MGNINTVVFGKRQKIKIAFRKLNYYIYKLITTFDRFVFKIQNKRNSSKILVVFDCSSEDEFSNALNKIFWALPSKKGLKIEILQKKSSKNFDLKDFTKPRYQNNFFTDNKTNISLIEKIRYKNLFDYDSILLTKYKQILFFLFPGIISKVVVADPYFFSHSEGSVWMRIYSSTINESEKFAFRQNSISNFDILSKKFSNTDNSYCFLTGPNFSMYKEFEFDSNSLKIVCNTIIKDKEFLEYINGPDLITFADPVFHFGPSQYAHDYRRLVLEVVKEYECLIVVPEVTVPLMLNHFPKLKNYIIGIDTTGEYNFPTSKNLNVYPMRSIVNLFMLPLASSLTNNIHFIGADGREKGEKYFWKHNDKVQFKGLMNTVFETHPSFFRDRDYASDFYNHSKDFEKLIVWGEKNGKKYYSLTPSHIPILKARMK